MSAPRSVIPRWLAINWWWLLAGNIVESELRAYIHHGTASPNGHVGTWFLTVWGLLQAGWLRSVDRRSRAFFWYAAAAVVDVLTILADSMSWHSRVGNQVSVFFFLTSIAVAIIGIFVFRCDMTRYFRETEDAGFELSGWMSLLFSDFYFQYHFHQMAEHQASSLRVAPWDSTEHYKG